MPRLPDLTNLGPRPVAQDRRGVVRQDTTAEGMGLARVSEAITQVGLEIEKKNDEQAVFEARRKLDEWERTTLYDPKSGVASKRGVDALDLPNKVTADYDKFAGEVGETLSSNRQRKAFQDLAQARRNQVADFTIRHALQQKEVYEKGQVNADMDTSRDRAMNLGSNGNVAGALAEIDVANSRLNSFLTARGVSPEEKAAALRANASRSHTGVIGAMLNKGDPMGAQAYLEANRDSMTQDDATRADGALKQGLLKVKSQAFADDAIDKQGLTLDDSLKLARSKLTGEEEAAAVSEIKTRFAEKEAVRAQDVKRISTDGWSVVVERGTRALTPTMLEELRTKAPEELRQMRDWEQAKWRQAKADAEGKDQDPQAYYGLRMMAAEDPGSFAKLDLMKSQPLMSKQHWNHLVEVQAAIGKGDLKAMESARVMKSTIGMLKAEIQAAGIDLSPKEGTTKAKETAMFMGAVNAALDEATASKGKPLTAEEARRIGMGMLRTGIEQGSGIFGIGQTKKRGFEIATDPNIPEGASFVTSRFADIPKAARDALTMELREARGRGTRPLTDDDEAAIERAYTRGVQQGRFK
jgi:hypothetical protein